MCLSTNMLEQGARRPGTCPAFCWSVTHPSQAVRKVEGERVCETCSPQPAFDKQLLCSRARSSFPEEGDSISIVGERRTSTKRTGHLRF